MVDTKEQERLRALRGYDILDTQPSRDFDRIVEDAAESFDTPIALISLVDADRQWFKAKVGLDVSETPRSISFCSYAVASGKTLIVEDATKDDRFMNNPMVLGDPSIRFYAGTPLETSQGHNIGTVCVIDRKPRRLDSVVVAEKLQRFADRVLDLIETKRQRATI